MTALAIRYLTRRCVAGDASRVAEWPPHPGRVFMALAAAHFEAQDAGPDEREALLWLEAQPSPLVTAPDAGEARTPVQTYVPGNDKAGGALVHGRKGSRSFPSVYVGDAPVVMRWPDQAPPAVREGLAALCGRVTRIGHSSSPVQMWVADPDFGAPGWMPVEFGNRAMRVATAGTLRSLSASFKAGNYPAISKWQYYARPQRTSDAPLAGAFEPEIIVFRKTDGSPLGMESTLQLTSALRNAAMSLCGQQPPPEWLSGHAGDGTPSRKNHAAFFPLPFVGESHADGHILGLGLALPRGISNDDLRPALGPLLFRENGSDRSISIWCPAGKKERFWEWTLERVHTEFPPQSLRSDVWTGPARVWESVTPVVLNRFPKRNRPEDVQQFVNNAVITGGYPPPITVEVTSVSFLAGCGDARSFPVYAEGGAGCRYQVHARLVFDDLLRGPVLVGRGRFRGYGLFRPRPGEQA